MSEQFKDYVTGTSFSLALSRRMIDMLSQMDQYGWAFGSSTTARSLYERGLIEWSHKDAVAAGESVPSYEFYKFYLTEAGKAVIPLLKLAGLYVKGPEIPKAVELPEPRITVRPTAAPTPHDAAAPPAPGSPTPQG